MHLQSFAHSHTVVGDSEVLTVPLVTDTYNYPILREEVEAAVKSLKKGKSPGIYRQYPGRAGTGRRRCRDKCFHIKSAIRFGRQESGTCHGPSLLSSPFPRKATLNSAITISLICHPSLSSMTEEIFNLRIPVSYTHLTLPTKRIV